MSYARFGEFSDVYIWGDGEYLFCDLCKLNDRRVQRFASRREMLEHLFQHRRIGHLIPDFAIERLEYEIDQYSDDYAATAKQSSADYGRQILANLEEMIGDSA